MVEQFQETSYLMYGQTNILKHWMIMEKESTKKRYQLTGPNINVDFVNARSSTCKRNGRIGYQKSSIKNKTSAILNFGGLLELILKKE